MESLKHARERTTPAGSGPGSRRCHLRRRWWVTIGVAAALIIILAIVLPCALILPNRGGDKGVSASVIFPLYIYPETNATWGPLYDAIASHPDLPFLIVINPSSGPGNGSAPDTSYQSAIRRLDSYANVQKVGYVRTNYAQRNVSEVLADVATYSSWKDNASDLAMSGIFFDESPHQYAAETVSYLEGINAAVKSAAGLDGEKTIIHNPGVLPADQLLLNTTDITVVFEQSYAHYEDSQEVQLDAASSFADRDSWAYIFHSLPDMSNKTLDKFVHTISHKAAYLYATTRTSQYYEHFDGRLEEFCDAVPT
ncbi:hypothetical protein BDW74DRAFT_158987 [Aspergillus multicolor]|uniref:spherulation-specific family 4 protein n=1 Tax=Aspergillus multicolor TaxID=41759 RepID=UPI003CCDD3FF